MDRGIAFAVALFLLGASISLFSDRETEVKFIKFVFGILIAYLAAQLKDDARTAGIKTSVFISSLYAVYLLMNTSRVLQMISGRFGTFNYLDVTLPLGLGLSFSLVLTFLIEKRMPVKILYLGLSILQTLAISQFRARGNILFPFMIVIFLLLLKDTKKLRQRLFNLLIAAVIIAVAVTLVMRYANVALVTRLLNTNVSNESRIPLYKFYLSYILHNFRFISGIGFLNSVNVLHKAGFHESYPHNLLLELIGEMGFIGIILVTTVGVKLVKNELRRMRYQRSLSGVNSEEYDRQMTQFFLLNAGFLFYFMSFMKSYSIYDGYQLFIFIAMLKFKKGVEIVSTNE